MSLTITEAHAVNVLLDWITGTPGVTHQVPTSPRALEAAQILADHANRALYAGWKAGDELRAAWPKELSRVTE